MYYLHVTAVENKILIRITMGTFQKCNYDLLSGDLI